MVEIWNILRGRFHLQQLERECDSGRGEDLLEAFQDTSLAQERMVDNGVPQSIETQCDDGTYAASKTVKNDLHGNMAGWVCGMRGFREASSLGSHLPEYYSQERRRNIWGIDKLSVSFFYQFLPRIGLLTTTEQ